MLPCKPTGQSKYNISCVFFNLGLNELWLWGLIWRIRWSYYTPSAEKYAEGIFLQCYLPPTNADVITSEVFVWPGFAGHIKEWLDVLSIDVNPCRDDAWV